MAVRDNNADQQTFAIGRLSVLEERVHGIESKLGEISNEISALLKDIQERAKTPWANIISACGVTLTVISIFGWLALSPIKDAAIDLKERLKLMEVTMVPRSEHVAKWENYETRHDDMVKMVDRLTGIVNETASSKDVLNERKDRLNRLEDRIRDLESRPRASGP